MTPPKLLGILGPLVAMIGALFLIYDALHGLVRWTEFIEWPIARFKGMQDQHKRYIQRIRNYGPDYPKERQQEELEREEVRYDEEVYKEQQWMAQAELRERKYSFKLALIGFALVAIGSGMQALAAGWPGPPVPPPCPFIPGTK